MTKNRIPPSSEQKKLSVEYINKINEWLDKNNWCTKSKLCKESGVSLTTVEKLKEGYISNSTIKKLDTFFNIHCDIKNISPKNKDKLISWEKSVIEKMGSLYTVDELKSISKYNEIAKKLIEDRLRY